MKKIFYTLIVISLLAACTKDQGSLKLKVTFAKNVNADPKVNFYASETAKADNDVFLFEYFTFENASEAEHLIEEIAVGDYILGTKVTIDSVDYSGTTNVTIVKGEEATATLTVQGNGNLTIVVRSSNNIPLGGAKVYLYKSENDMLAENYSELRITDRQTPANGTTFINLPFAEYFFTAKWRSDPSSNYLIGSKKNIWVNNDEDKKISITVFQ